MTSSIDHRNAQRRRRHPAAELGTVRRSRDGRFLAVLWPAPPHPHRWMVTDQWGSCGYELDEKVAAWPVVGTVPFSPAALAEPQPAYSTLVARAHHELAAPRGTRPTWQELPDQARAAAEAEAGTWLMAAGSTGFLLALAHAYAAAEDERRFWAIWSPDRARLRAQVAGAGLTGRDAVLARAFGTFAPYLATSILEQVDEARYAELLESGGSPETEHPGEEDAPEVDVALRPAPAVGEQSPTDPGALGTWLRALPAGTILGDRGGRAAESDTGAVTREGRLVRAFPALYSTRFPAPRELTEGHEDLVTLARVGAPFTILALPAPPETQDEG